MLPPPPKKVVEWHWQKKMKKNEERTTKLGREKLGKRRHSAVFNRPLKWRRGNERLGFFFRGQVFGISTRNGFFFLKREAFEGSFFFSPFRINRRRFIGSDRWENSEKSLSSSE